MCQLQKDITITKNKINIGSIWSSILLNFSDLIKTSLENKNNFDGESIDIVKYEDMFIKKIVHIYKIKNYKPRWSEIFDIINGQTIFMKYMNVKDISRKELNDLIYVQIIAEYFMMNDLNNYLQKLLSMFDCDKKNCYFLEFEFSVDTEMGYKIDTSRSFFVNEDIFIKIRDHLIYIDRIDEDYCKNKINVEWEWDYDDRWYNSCESATLNITKLENIEKYYDYIKLHHNNNSKNELFSAYLLKNIPNEQSHDYNIFYVFQAYLYEIVFIY